MEKPLVYIIILNYNGRRWLENCLITLAHTRYENYCVIVVDNASTDDSLEILKDRFPEIEVIENRSNLGFSEGNNVGIQAALQNNPDYLVLLNPDTKVESDWLVEIVAAGEADKRIGILGAVQLEYDTDELNSWTRSAAKAHLEELRFPESAQSFVPMDWVEGACLVVKREVFEEIGLLDPIYFAFYEEIDLCRRALCARFKVGLATRSRIHHYRGGCWEADSMIKRERDYRCDRSQFIYTSTDPRRTLTKNLYWYAITFGTKLKALAKEFSLAGVMNLAKMQVELLFTAGAIVEKWRKDRAQLGEKWALSKSR